MTPEEQYDAVMTGLDPAVAQAVILKFLFIKTAQIDGSLDAMVPVLGSIAARVGVTAAQLERMQHRQATIIDGHEEGTTHAVPRV